MDEHDSNPSRHYWDKEAATFDDEPDHGLRDPVVRSAWRDLLHAALPPTPAAVLDMGCGTGSLSILLASLGYEVTGVDFSPAMIARAEAKAQAAGCEIAFHLGDAADPQPALGVFEVIICRHLLWALPDLTLVLKNWATRLAANGRLLLIEGYWHTGGGLHASQITAVLPPYFKTVVVKDLSSTFELWGTDVLDERYLIIAQH